MVPALSALKCPKNIFAARENQGSFCQILTSNKIVQMYEKKIKNK